MNVDYIMGLQEAHRLLADMHREVRREIDETPGMFFGLLPTRRHFELSGASRALGDLSIKITDAATGAQT